MIEIEIIIVPACRRIEELKCSLSIVVVIICLKLPGKCWMNDFV